MLLHYFTKNDIVSEKIDIVGGSSHAMEASSVAVLCLGHLPCRPENYGIRFKGLLPIRAAPSSPDAKVNIVKYSHQRFARSDEQ